MMTAFLAAVVADLFSVPAYEFVPALDRMVGIIRQDGTILIGRFDADGEFTQIAVEKAGYRGGAKKWQFVGSSSSKPEVIYELRSGTLILGTQSASAPFIPKVGAAVIRFTDYKYFPAAPRIWNLPGYFWPVGVPRSPAPEKWTPLPPWPPARPAPY